MAVLADKVEAHKCLRSTSSGILMMFCLGTAIYSAYPPFLVLPKVPPSSQIFSFPCLHCLHFPQNVQGYMTTFSFVSSIFPAISDPSINGNFLEVVLFPST